MGAAEARAAALAKLSRTPSPKEQDELRASLRGADGYLAELRAVYLQNPFLKLTEDEAAALTGRAGEASLAGLIADRNRAMHSVGLKPVVFCMPKSGSSFLKSGLQEALQLPSFSLTSFGADPSYFGMNAREQEIDELALVKACLLAPRGFVAQHHTRYTPYLGLQLGTYRLRPIVTVRNIADALVSYDDMMMAWRGDRGAEGWMTDGPFAMPLDYQDLPVAERLRILGFSLGVWLIQFHLSWLRGMRQRIVDPLLIRYEQDILDPQRLVARLAEALGLDDLQAGRLGQFVARPDRVRSRLNVGRAGRGREVIPKDVRDFLERYARTFANEFGEDEIAYLLA